jgi:CheY-like chemotaxis protein
MRRILVVDDDPILLRVYQSKLTSEGFAVEAVADGAAALMAIAAKPPDVVLLDLMLPDINGVEVIRTVRSRERGRRTPIVVLSNLYLEAESAAATTAGADLVIDKAGTTPRKVVEAIRGLRSVMAPAAEFRPLPMSAVPPPAASAVPLPPPPSLPRPPEPVSPGIVHGAAALDIVPQAGTRAHQDASQSFVRSEVFLPQIAPSLAEAERHLAALAHGPAALTHLSRLFHHLGNRAVTAQRWDVAKLAAAGESLVHQVRESPRYLTPSTIRTLTQAIARFPLLAAARTAGTDLATIPTMVLDDEGVSRTTMGLALGKVGLQATPVADPRQALEALKHTRFHLILSDVMMNGMSGFQFAAQVRTMTGYARTPIIFVTALGEFESQFRASSHGADDLIAKPFLLMELGTKALLHVLTGDGDPWQGS